MNKIIQFIFLLLVSISFLNGAEWKDFSLTVVKEEKVGSENRINLKYEKSEILVRYFGEISEKNMKKIGELTKKFHSWKYMVPEKVEFYIANDLVEILILPKTFKYKGIDITKFLPAGMLFIQGEHLNYNFRITKDNLFVRIKDYFKHEELLCENLASAINDPLTYLKLRDPAYLLKKMQALEKKLEQLQGQFDEVKQRSEKNDEILGRIGNGIVTLHNRGFLGIGYKAVKRDVIDKIVEMKKENPKYDKKQIKKALEKKNVKVSEHVVFLVLSLYYNEFK